jgi:hypothetical protein
MVNNKLEFKGAAGRLVLYFAGTNGIMAITFLVSRSELRVVTALMLFFIVNIFCLFWVISQPFKLIIQQDTLQLEIHYLLSFFRKTTVIPLQDIACSFNYEVVARGAKVRVLRIAYRDKTLVKLLPESNGWSEEILSQVYEKLNGRNTSET